MDKKNVKGKTCCFMGERERMKKHETKLYYGKDLKKICGSLPRTVSMCEIRTTTVHSGVYNC